MSEISHDGHMQGIEVSGHSSGALLRSFIIGLTAFLTVVDLFATQAILPTLAKHYNVTPAAMGLPCSVKQVLDRKETSPVNFHLPRSRLESAAVVNHFITSSFSE